MLHALSTGLGRAVWHAVPALVVLALTLSTMVPIDLGAGWLVAPNVAMIAVFFWTIYAPQFYSPLAIFSSGAAIDLLGAGPLGFWPLVLLTLYALTASQREFFIGRSVLGLWAGFGIFASLVSGFAWVLACSYNSQWLEPGPILWQAVVTIAAFPILARMFALMKRQLSGVNERLAI